MSERVFGLSVNEVMAYAAVANVLLVLVLAGVNIYYAWHSKRQADATQAQVDASQRQAEIAEQSLSLLRKQMAVQRTADLATVSLQIKVATHTIDDWLKRIGGEGFPQLPEEIRILPADFSVAIQRANTIDQIVAENMGAASLYAGKAEANLETLRTQNPAQAETWKEMRAAANNNLNIARYKLNVARARWETEAGVTEKS